MPQTRDRRRRGDLDIFLLALVSSGLANPYALQKAARLSPGATIPALERLVEAGYVRQAKPGPYGRTDHQITPEGRKYLKIGWRGLIEDGPSGDLDADLRVALLALSVGGERGRAADFLKQSAVKKRASLKALVKNTEYASGTPLADCYTRLRSEASKALLTAESAAALSMAKALPRKLSSGRSR